MSNQKENLQTEFNPNESGTRRIPGARTKFLLLLIIVLAAISIIVPIVNWGRTQANAVTAAGKPKKGLKKFKSFDDQISANANELIDDGRQVFRFNTFGDEKFWGDTLQLHKAIEGANLGGVGPGISPQVALDLGLKVDVDALPEALVNQFDSFEADRAPDHAYKTMNLAGLFVRENGRFMKPSNKGRFYHDGRFANLLDVVSHYNVRFNLGLTAQEKHDLVEYLKSLPESE